MGGNTKIEWTDATFNPWIGCQKVSAGCLHCYAETLTQRYKWVEWGPQGVRQRTSPGNWKKPLMWQRKAERDGVRRRVFCASLADIFDTQAPEGAREDLWELIRTCPDLDWQLLTKRPENALTMLPVDWGRGYSNVWIGTTAEDQKAYDRRWPILQDVPARLRFVSYEPAIGPLSLEGHQDTPDWLIWGGESGPGARRMEPTWARNITNECRAGGVPVFGKQWGTYSSNPAVVEDGATQEEAESSDPKTNGKGGALLDGRLWREFPGWSLAEGTQQQDLLQ